ncbi:MAG: SDR family oxidoreductase [Thaumarchaeota archaeon]|nr:SDR family oxidoreductase [Nitrososphaerota archaeon]
MSAQESTWIREKTCMITGANSGIGKAAAAGLAKMGAKIAMVCRDAGRGEEARTEILRASGARSEDVSLMIADLASLESVRRLASEFLQTKQPLHVLMNNAGLILGKRTVTKDGLETTFEVNYLSHFLLTGLLLGTMKASAPSRIINVSSDAHTGGHIDFEDLQEEKSYGGLRSYSQSKLAQVLFTFELAKKLQGTGVTVNAVHPGVVATNWATRSAGLLSIGIKLAHPFMMGAEKGADTLVYLASSPEVADVTGKYFTKRKAVPSSKDSMDEPDAKKLWDVSLKLAKLETDPTVT